MLRRQGVPSELKPTDRIVCERLRLIREGDYLDLSYCLVTVNGEPAMLEGLPRDLNPCTWKQELLAECKKAGVYIERLLKPGVHSIMYP